MLQSEKTLSRCTSFRVTIKKHGGIVIKRNREAIERDWLKRKLERATREDKHLKPTNKRRM